MPVFDLLRGPEGLPVDQTLFDLPVDELLVRLPNISGSLEGIR
ncbi:unnamed protein product [uncultured virus]|nr:unnamed protein product [uncultured virus]